MPSTIGQSICNVALFSAVFIGASVVHWFGSKERNKTKEQTLNDTRPKVIVISGCDRGFGKLIAEQWSFKDFIVVALTLTAAGAKSLEDDHSNIIAVQCDVTSSDDIDKLREKIEKLLTERNAILYSIVNNAGIADPGDFVFYQDLSIPRRVMDVNYFGQLAVTQALLPLMLCTSQVAGGKIFNMSSVCGSSASPSNSAYNASKFAVEAWSDALRIELKPFGIQVATIRPGQFKTDIQEEWWKNYLNNYQASPQYVQNLYGAEAFLDGFYKQRKIALEQNNATEPSVLVDTLTHLLTTADKLKPKYWVGNDAETFWKAMSLLPASTSDTIKSLLALKPAGPSLPPPNAVSHVTIRVRNLEKSLSFYKSLGFETVGPTEYNCQFLQFNPSNNGTWESLVLLKEDDNMPERERCSDLGMTRLCIMTTSIDRDIHNLKSNGLNPIAPMVTHGEKLNGEKLAVYTDPDGFVIYLVEFTGLAKLMVGIQLWLAKKKTPSLFHWTINVTDSKLACAFFEQFHFKTIADLKKDEVVYDLLPAFKIDAKSTVIDFIRLCYPPKGGLVATIMEWTTPKSVLTRHSLSNSMTLSVVDVKSELDKAKKLGLITEEKPKYQSLPIFGNVLVGKAYMEQGSCPVEFCCFSNQKP